MNLLLLLGCFQSWNVTSDCTPVERFLDEDGDGFGAEALSACPGQHPARYSSEQGGDCDDADPQVHPGQEESCDGQDNNCDGEIDEGVIVDFYADADSDGFGSGDPQSACADAPPFSPAATQGGDCSDTDAGIYPGADEICNGTDDDCDDLIDEDPTSGPTWYTDADNDGYGDPASPVVACEQPSGLVSLGSDCDDTDLSVFPGAPEICGDGIVNDCEAESECRLTGSERLNTWDQAFGTVVGEGLGFYLDSGDLSGDGLSDLSASVSPESSVGGVVVSYDYPSPKQTLYYHQINSSGFGVHDIGDMSGDGQADLVVAAEDYGVAYLFEGPLPADDTYVPHHQAQGTFKFDPQDPGDVQLLIPGDLDGDGQPELALSNSLDSEVTILSGVWPAGSGYEQTNTWATLSSDESRGGHAMESADLNGDGLPELAVLARRVGYLVDTDQISAVADLEDCSTTLTDSPRLSDISPAGDASGSGAQAFWLSTADDGIALWSGEADWNGLSVYLSLSSEFALQGPLSGGQDMDGDGATDLAFSVVDSLGESGICLTYGPFKGGTLSPDYCATEKGITEAGAAVLLTPDLDGDGVPDLAAGDPSASGGDGIVYTLFGTGI